MLGQGGFGITYLATDFELGGPCVVKELALGAVCTRVASTGAVSTISGREVEYRGWLDRFEREAHAIHQIQHPNVVRVLASWRERGTAYYAMDLVPDARELPSLDEPGWQPMQWARAEQIALGMLSALHAVHGAGLVHGDIKPSNVLLDTLDRPVLIDFGTVRTQSDLVRTITGAVYTPGYAPPELSARADLPAAGPRSDLYSWAMVVWGLVTPHQGVEGRPVDAATRLAIADSRGRDHYSTPGALMQAGVPPRWAEIVCSCQQLPASRRPERIPVIWAALQSQVSVAPVPASAQRLSAGSPAAASPWAAPAAAPSPGDARGSGSTPAASPPAPPEPAETWPRPVVADTQAPRGPAKRGGWRWMVAAGAVAAAAALVAIALPSSPVERNATATTIAASQQDDQSKGAARPIVASRELLIGTWNVDLTQTIMASNTSDEDRMAAMALTAMTQIAMRFERNGAMRFSATILGESETDHGTYRVVSRDRNLVEVESTMDSDGQPHTETALVRFLSRDSATYTPEGGEVMYMDRAR